MTNSPEHIHILGVRVDLCTSQQAVQSIITAAQVKQKYTVVTVNPEFIMTAQQDSHFKDVLNQADLAVADGIGLLWASNVLSYHPHLPTKSGRYIEALVVGIIMGIATVCLPKIRYRILPAKVSGADLVEEISNSSQDHHLSLFLLGAGEGVADQAAKNLLARYPQLAIAGTFSGDSSQFGDQQTRQAVNQHPADIILVAYGAPRQELWMNRNLPHITATVGIGIGGTFDFLAGTVRRAPNLVKAVGLEWLFRLIVEPWRWRRQLALPRFVWAVIRSATITNS